MISKPTPMADLPLPPKSSSPLLFSSHPPPQMQNFKAYEDGSESESPWLFGILAQNPKSILNDDDYDFRSILNKLTTSLNQMGETFEKEGPKMVKEEAESQTSISGGNNSRQPLTNESRLKSSRELAIATVTKAKELLRDLKMVKADLGFAKEQLEDQNRGIRDEIGEKSNNNHADDDLIRLQLETLLAEKARLTHENWIYARENRLLREIVEYHQMKMQEEFSRTLSSASQSLIGYFPSPCSSSPVSPSRYSIAAASSEIYPFLLPLFKEVGPSDILQSPPLLSSQSSTLN